MAVITPNFQLSMRDSEIHGQERGQELATLLRHLALAHSHNGKWRRRAQLATASPTAAYPHLVCVFCVLTLYPITVIITSPSYENDAEQKAITYCCDGRKKGKKKKDDILELEGLESDAS